MLFLSLSYGHYCHDRTDVSDFACKPLDLWLQILFVGISNQLVQADYMQSFEHGTGYL